MVLITSKILYIRITVLLDTTYIVYCIFSEKCGHVLTIVNKLSGLVSKQSLNKMSILKSTGLIETFRCPVLNGPAMQSVVVDQAVCLLMYDIW